MAAGVTTVAPGRAVAADVPWLIVYFLAVVAANSLGLIPHGWHAQLSRTAVFLITTALVGIGLSTRFRDMRVSRMAKSAPVPGSCIGRGDP